MAEKNYKTVAVVPEMPRTIDMQQLHVYTPIGSTGNFGVFKPDGKQFVITADGKLRVDVSKLIQLDDPAVTVVEDGGAVDAEVKFTETDSTLLRKFAFVFKNIKGDTGDKGDTGLSALESTFSWISVNKPAVDTQSSTLLDSFNRTPIVGDTFIAVYRYTDLQSKTLIAYLIYCEVTEVQEATNTCRFKIVRYVEIPSNYITEITGPVTDGLNDTYTIVFSNGETYEYTVTNGAQGPTGATGATGAQGPKGDDGVSITGVTQEGVQGGTLVTITLSDGQSTSFTVYNGINTEFQVVQTLPTSDISTSTIYLVPSEHPGDENVYDEYIYVNGNWEHIGSTTVDLADYVTKTYFDQTVGTATKNYINAQVSKIQNMYIEMYESGSVPVKDQALTLTNANFARVPAAGQYFSLIEVVNTKDKYYSVCKIATVDTTTCSATVVSVTELDSGTEIAAIKASIEALTTTVDGKADASALNNKLDKVTTASTAKQAYVKNADGTQGMLDVGGTTDDDIATVGQVKAEVTAAEPYFVDIGSGRSGTITEAQYNGLKADKRSYVLSHNKPCYFGGYNDDDGVELLMYTTQTSGAFITITIRSDNFTWRSIEGNFLSQSFISTTIEGSGSNSYVPSTKAVVDYVAANAGKEAYHIEVTSGGSSTLSDEQITNLVEDTDSYILYTYNNTVYKLCRNSQTSASLIYSTVVEETEYRVIVVLAQKQWLGSSYKLQEQNITTAINANSTDTQYPSAKATYDADQATLTAAKSYADTAIANAITTTLNTPV